MSLLFAGRRTIRGEVNPLDKCTIFSIYPRDIRETKHTIQPGIFELSAGRLDKPTRLVVGPSSWWRDIDEDMPLVEIPTSSIQVANSVVTDYCNGLLAFDTARSSPGLFFLPGDISVKELTTEPKYKVHLDKAAIKQKEWYRILVQMADTNWSRSNANPIAISDDMRLAAQELSLKDKPWMKDFTTIEMVNCPACGALRNPMYPICGACHTVVDRKKFEELGLSQQKAS